MKEWALLKCDYQSDCQSDGVTDMAGSREASASKKREDG